MVICRRRRHTWQPAAEGGTLGNLPQKAAHLLILYSKVRYAKVLATAFGPFALVHKKFPPAGLVVGTTLAE